MNIPLRRMVPLERPSWAGTHGIFVRRSEYGSRTVAAGRPEFSPARLSDSGNESLRGILSEGNPREFEAANESPASSGCRATINQSGGACVPGEHRKSFVILLGLELLTKLGVLGYGFCFALVAFYPGLFCHDCISGRDSRVACEFFKKKKRCFQCSFFLAKAGVRWQRKNAMFAGLLYVVIFIALGLICFAFLKKT